MSDNSESDEYPLSRAGKLLLGAWSLLLLAGFVVARSLEPDPRGYGTHERLGLPSCTFRATCGIACPSCGMTTSFAYFTRGRMIDAARANAAGLVLAVVCAVQIPWAWVSLACGRLWRIRRPDVAPAVLVAGLAGAAGVHWCFRLLAGG